MSKVRCSFSTPYHVNLSKRSSVHALLEAGCGLRSWDQQPLGGPGPASPKDTSCRVCETDAVQA